jgi:predicted transposase YbfD/YdcC
MMNEDILLERKEALEGLLEELNAIPDSRIERCKRFSIGEILLIVLCAQICGYETFREYEAYGYCKIELLRKFLAYKNGPPSRSTIARILALIDPKMMENLFVKWVQDIIGDAKKDEPGTIAIDGKTHCGAKGEKLHLVTAFDTKSQLILAEEKVNERSNEIPAIPLLLDLLSISGHLVSIDAMGCQKIIADKIRTKKGHYLLALKQNQGELYQEIDDFFSDQDCLKKCATVTRTDKGHGRLEKRTCYTTENISWINKKSDWKDLKSIAMIISERSINGVKSTEKRYFISSANADPVKILAASRAHWGIENSVHWVLDVIFGEDTRIIWDHNIAHNEAIIRKMALNLLRKYSLTKPVISPGKISLKILRKTMVLDDQRMHQLLKGAS